VSKQLFGHDVGGDGRDCHANGRKEGGPAATETYPDTVAQKGTGSG
jgi:hypothetical protein